VTKGFLGIGFLGTSTGATTSPTTVSTTTTTATTMTTNIPRPETINIASFLIFNSSSTDSFVYHYLALVSGHFNFTKNTAKSAKFPALSTVSGNFIVFDNPFLVLFDAPELKIIGGVISIVANNAKFMIIFSPVRMFEARCVAGSSDSVDYQGCTRIDGFSQVSQSLISAVTSLPLTYAAGHFEIISNAFLTTIYLPSLSSVIGFLSIQSNPLLTFAHLPRLTLITDRIFFCQNHASFVVPFQPPDAPVGGLVVTGSRKGTGNCRILPGSTACSTLTTCP
jgi:hypothetical protein